MKHIALLVFASIMGCATPECVSTQAQIKWGEVYAEGVLAQTVRSLECYNHQSRTGNHGSCLGQEKDIGGLGINRDPAVDRALAQMYAFGLDASNYGSRECMSLIRGKALLPALRALNPKQARQKCEALFAQSNINIAHDFPKADINNVCHSEAEIRSNLDRIIGKIEAGKTCEPWNDPD